PAGRSTLVPSDRDGYRNSLMQNAKCKMQKKESKAGPASRRRPSSGILHFAFCILNFALLISIDAQVRPVYDSGAAGLAHLLGRLKTTAGVLHTGAHPDDEDSAIVARSGRGDARG